LVQILTGGYEIDYFKTIGSLQSFDENVAAQMQWSENSIGMLFAPNNAWQSLLYLPPRMVLYLAAPLPNIAVSVPDLLTGSWSAWQHLMTMPSSVLNLLALPYALAGFALAWRRRRELPAPLVLHLTFWMVFMTIAGGNIIIHERYRLMMTLLFFACAWFGYTSCTRNQVRKFSLPWLCLLVAGGLFFLIYKTL
jgi:small-conductance mechanosensitive channel